MVSLLRFAHAFRNFPRLNMDSNSKPLINHNPGRIGAYQACELSIVTTIFPFFRYIPPLIWGRSGHLQTIIHSTLSRHKAPREKGDSRHAILLSDGTTVTFDLFLPPSELNKNLQSPQKGMWWLGSIERNASI